MKKSYLLGVVCACALSFVSTQLSADSIVAVDHFIGGRVSHKIGTGEYTVGSSGGVSSEYLPSSNRETRGFMEFNLQEVAISENQKFTLNLGDTGGVTLNDSETDIYYYIVEDFDRISPSDFTAGVVGYITRISRPHVGPVTRVDVTDAVKELIIAGERGIGFKFIAPQPPLGTYGYGDAFGVVSNNIVLTNRKLSSLTYETVILAVVANAGEDQATDEGVTVTLDGTASQGATNFTWTQIAGNPTVVMDNADTATPSFDAPYVPENTNLTFKLVVDDGTTSSDPDTVDVKIVNANNPPVADAGDSGTIKEGGIASLNGSNSYDPEGDDPLDYSWTKIGGPQVELDLADPVNPTFMAPLGVGTVLYFELLVYDGKEFSATDDVTVTVVENSQPVADAGSDQTKGEGVSVMLNGEGSSDADNGDALSFFWTQLGGTAVALDSATSNTPSFYGPAVAAGGEDLVFSLVVTDNDPVNPRTSDPDEVIVSIRNINDPPSCHLAKADLTLLWPPNHKMETVTIVGVMDVDSPYNEVTLAITEVTQDEPVNGLGDGDSSPDGVIQSGTPADAVLVRAERAGIGNGRVYQVHFAASDGFESCTGSVTTSVPHDRKDTAVDDGQFYDSTRP